MAPAPLTNVMQARFTLAATPAATAFFCRIDALPFEPCTASVVRDVSIDGPHGFDAFAAVGGISDPTPAHAQWTLDTSAPTTTLLQTPAPVIHTALSSVVFESNEPAHFACRLDSATPVPCQSPWTLDTLDSGQHFLLVRATDTAGNREVNPPGVSFFVDLPPETVLTSVPPSPTESAFATLAFLGSDDFGVTGFICRLDAGPETPCTSPLVYDNLTEGTHTASVAAVDSAGLRDPTPATYSWLIDQGLPPTTILEAAPSSLTPLTQAVFRFRSTANDLADFVCSDDGGAPAVCPSPHTRFGLAAGDYWFRVQARDQGGNIDPVGAAWRWRVTNATAAQWQSVDVEQDHACAVRTDGSLWCWGSGAFGKLGLGAGDDATQPTRVGDRNDWIAVNVGRQHTCGLTTPGALWCWGDDTFGQIGDGGSAENATQPVQIATATTWSTLSAGAWHTCAVATNGGVWCWGLGTAGRLGNGGTASQAQPSQVVGLPAAVTLATGAAHTCAIVADGSLYCWGANFAGQLGNGTLTEALAPVLIDPGLWQVVAAGGEHTCGVQDGVALCWGANDDRQLGTVDPASQLLPVAVSGLPATIVTITAGGSHSCAVASDGSLWCWGANDGGQVGRNAPATDDAFSDGAISSPTAVGEDMPWLDAAGGTSSTCGRRNDASLWCWGSGPVLPPYAAPQTQFPAWLP